MDIKISEWIQKRKSPEKEIVRLIKLVYNKVVCAVC